jgi:hypothetical protein
MLGDVRCARLAWGVLGGRVGKGDARGWWGGDRASVRGEVVGCEDGSGVARFPGG